MDKQQPGGGEQFPSDEASIDENLADKFFAGSGIPWREMSPEWCAARHGYRMWSDFGF
jgi:hypothetical protein